MASAATLEGTPRPPASKVAPPLRYIPALDGLRGLAVLAVIVFHFEPDWLPAGFLGVDVFFVVSGFLITRLLLAEMNGSGGLRLRGFWGRRARRLLPAFTTMLAIVAVLSLLRLPDALLHDLRLQFVASLAYVGNWGLIFGHTSYFAAAAGPSPLVHVWSLAVEEQFYLVMPLVLILSRRMWQRSRSALALIFIGGAVLSSMLMALAYDAVDPSRAYYGTDTHAMGLLLGAALCVLLRADQAPRIRHPSTVEPRRLRGLLAVVVVVGAMRLFDYNSPLLYRGGFFVFAIVCCVVIAAVVQKPSTVVSRIFASSALVTIGLRSYSLYLCQWPVAVFVDQGSTGLSGYPLLLVRTCILLCVAEISYRLVESPFRTGSLARRYGVRSALVYSAAASVIVLLLVARMPSAGHPTTLSSAIRSAASTAPPAGSSPAATPLRADVFGDSTALELGYQGEMHSAELPEIAPGGIATFGCSVVPGDYYIGSNREPQPDQCVGWQDRWRSRLAQTPDDVALLMTGRWDLLDHRSGTTAVRFGTEAWTTLVETSVNQAVDVLREGGLPVYILEAPCYSEGDWGVPAGNGNVDPARVAALNAIFHDVAAHRPDVYVLPLQSLVCPAGRLLTTIDGKTMWDVDGIHLSPEGAVLVWHWIATQIGDPKHPR